MKLATLILTADSRQFLWEPMAEHWRKYPIDYSQVDGSTYVVGESWPEDRHGLAWIAGGKCDLRNWSTWLACALREFEGYTHALLMLDDIWPIQRIMPEDIAYYVRLASGRHYPCFGIHLNSPYYATLQTGINVGGFDVLQMKEDSKYQLSLQPTIWHRETLSEILSAFRFNPWDFERHTPHNIGPRRFVNRHWYAHVIRRGDWTQEGKAIMEGRKHDQKRSL